MTKRAKAAEARIAQLEQERDKAVEARMQPTSWDRLDEKKIIAPGFVTSYDDDGMEDI